MSLLELLIACKNYSSMQTSKVTLSLIELPVAGKTRDKEYKYWCSQANSSLSENVCKIGTCYAGSISDGRLGQATGLEEDEEGCS